MKYIEKFIGNLEKPLNYCEKFDPLKLACYFDNSLKENEKKVFENHLLNCGFCFTKFMELKKDLCLYKKPIRKIKNLIPIIAIKSFEKGIKIIKFFNIKQNELVYAPAFRSENNKKFLKRVNFSFDDFKIELIHVGKNIIFLKLKRSKGLLYKTVSLFRNDKLLRVKNFNKSSNLIFDNLKKGNYKIKIMDKIFKLVIK